MPNALKMAGTISPASLSSRCSVCTMMNSATTNAGRRPRLVTLFAMAEPASPGEREEQRRPGQQDDHDEGADGRGVAVVAVDERLLVDVVDDQRGRVGRPALGHDVDQVEP